MVVSTGLRRALLVAHISCSVGWIGAVVTYLVIAVLIMISSDLALLRATYPLMEQLVWFVILPFNLLSLASGVLSSLVSPWGLLRHYWVTTKLILNCVTTVFLLGYTQELGQLVQVASRAVLTATDVQALRQPTSVVHSVVALALLLVATVLAVYKPRGLTRYGQRQAARRRSGRQVAEAGV